MFNTLANLFSSTSYDVSPEKEWETWIEWQGKQPPSHYEKSDIFHYFLKYHPDFTPPVGSAMSDRCSRFYQYCFGDFAVMVVNPNPGSNAVEYFSLLLDVYDTCKGYTRRIITGDPAGITSLRQVIQLKSMAPLFKQKFDDYGYDYGRIHAHTVSQYSLSTLIMRLVSNYMSHIQTRAYYPYIDINVCEKAYESCIFGEPKRFPITTPSSSVIPIRQPYKPVEEESRACSWPRDPSTCPRCRKCRRITENLYGNFNSCLDCHMKRICSTCGDVAIIIGSDNLPKCYIHQSVYLED